MQISAASPTDGPYSSDLSVHEDDHVGRLDARQDELLGRPRRESLHPSVLDLVAITAPVLAEILRADELDTFWIGREPGPAGTDVPAVKICAQGESFSLQLSATWESFDGDRARELLRSALQDFVAESEFGWGQQR